ncbi:hypothetical protein [Nocardia sp. NPDC005366]|uniref:hypothetical protein n=1 Tax=Nocardia sp. NPDC005366 TaxID=3156878 RepID=UPI0033A90327
MSKERDLRDTGVHTTAVVRRGVEWRIAAFQNTKYHWLFARFGAGKDPVGTGAAEAGREVGTNSLDLGR